MNIGKSTVAALVASASIASLAVTPEVTAVSMSQASDRLVTITYTLGSAPAVVTLDVQTNATENAAADDPGWTSIGGEAVWNAMGDVWRKVETGNHTITWHPDQSWPDHKIDGDRARAVVTAWALDNTPDYMVVDLVVTNCVRYYPGIDYLPGTAVGQTGAITNNPAFKTTQLVMRKIMARGVEWTMGSQEPEVGWTYQYGRETVHKVTLANNYYIGVFEVTQAQWKNITRLNSISANFQVDGAMRPMDNVAYNEIRNNRTVNTSGDVNAGTLYADPSGDSFLVRLRNVTGIDFDLPSDAQWEFAARAGNGLGYWGDGSTIISSDSDAHLARIARYRYNGGKIGENGDTTPANTCGVENGTAIVGSYMPNAWGIYDMHGNVNEWCLDWFESDLEAARDTNGEPYNGRVNINPSNVAQCLSGETATVRVFRGGGWAEKASACRSAFRGTGTPNIRSANRGFRVACTGGLR